MDTLNKRLYILYSTNMSIFSYALFPTLGVGNNLTQRQQFRSELQVLPCQSGVIIIFPGCARHADLFFYDLFDRLVDKLTVIGSNSILWQPKSHIPGCFSVSAKIDGENYSARFMTR